MDEVVNPANGSDKVVDPANGLDAVVNPTSESDKRTPVFISSDHRGYDARKELAEALSMTMPQIKIENLGPAEYDEDDDFNDAAIKVCRKVLDTPGAKGIIICGSAIGVAMQANRFKGIRAAAVYSLDLAKLAREHEDANVICLSADLNTKAQNYQAIKVFLNTEAFEKERYKRRIRRLDEDVDIKEGNNVD